MKFYGSQLPALLGKYLYNEAPHNGIFSDIYFPREDLQLKIRAADIRGSFICLLCFLLLEICFV
jgi:hypothetical protein